MRRSMHEALDLILDAIAQEQRAEPKKQTRKAKPRLPPLPANVTETDIANVSAALERVGYRKAG